MTSASPPHQAQRSRWLRPFGRSRSSRLFIAGLVAVLALIGATVVVVVHRHGSSGTTSTGGDGPLPLAGDLDAHDPSFTVAGNDWFVLGTGDAAVHGGTIQIKESTDRQTFTSVGTVWDAIPAWIVKAIPQVTNLWAPQVYLHDGTYYLYYAASSFGSNTSLIALATNTTLDPAAPGYHWVDRGLVLSSQSSDDFNAIDPAVIEDPHGTPYLTFGSFWSGIRQVKLQWPSGKPAAGVDLTDPTRLVNRGVPPNAVEAPYMIRHQGYYYLFVSFDFCCRGAQSTYKIAVGRSRSIEGPFTDESGQSLLQGGGTVILASHGSMIGPGGVSIAGDLLAHHYYDADAAGATTLAIHHLGWSSAGWPELSW